DFDYTAWARYPSGSLPEGGSCRGIHSWYDTGRRPRSKTSQRYKSQLVALPSAPLTRNIYNRNRSLRRAGNSLKVSDDHSVRVRIIGEHLRYKQRSDKEWMSAQFDHANAAVGIVTRYIQPFAADAIRECFIQTVIAGEDF